MNRLVPFPLSLALAALLALGTGSARAQKSEEVVKASATAEKAAADGKQEVVVTLEINKAYHIYANPIGNEDLASNQTTVNVLSGTKKLGSVKVAYPQGELKKDAVVGDYKVYTGKVTIKATVQRDKGDTGPLTVAVDVQACSGAKCLQPSKIMVKVP